MAVALTEVNPGHYAPKPLAMKQQYVEWLFTPQDQREWRTKSDWAAAHDVSRQALWNWENSDETVLGIIREWRKLTEAHWPAVAATLVSIATDRDHPNVVQGIRTLAEMLDKFPSKSMKLDHQVTITGIYAAAAAALEAGDIEGEVEE